MDANNQGTKNNHPVYYKETEMSLNEAVQDMRKDAIKKQADPEQGKTQKQLKIDLVGDKYSQLVMIARRIATELAQHGPITIDDVTFKMAEHDNVLPSKGKEQRWKGKVFANKTQWVSVGFRPAMLKTSHARKISMWALKTWLQNHSMNGMQSNVSAYVLTRIYSDFTKNYPGALQLDSCTWEIGDRCLSPEVKRNIDDAHGKLYGIQVKMIPNAVGAVLRG